MVAAFWAVSITSPDSSRVRLTPRAKMPRQCSMRSNMAGRVT